MPSLDTFSDVVQGGINATGSSAWGMVDSYGCPKNNPLVSNPTNLITTPHDSVQNGGFIDSLEAYGGNAINSVKNATSTLWAGADDLASQGIHGIETVGGAVFQGATTSVKFAYDGVKTVVGDVSNGVGGVTSGIYNRALLWVVVVGGMIYLIASTNNFKVNASV